MQQLHLVGFTADNRGLIFSARKGSKSGGFVVTLDDKLLVRVDEMVARREAEEQDHQSSNRPKSSLSPREIQARLRAGRTISQVAREAGVEEEWVARWAAPILAEQSQVVERAQGLTMEKNRVGPSAVALGDAVRWNMADKGIVFTDAGWAGSWDAFHLRDNSWMVRFTYVYRRATHQAEWEVDTRDAVVVSRNRQATDLGYVAPGRRRPKMPRSTLAVDLPSVAPAAPTAPKTGTAGSSAPAGGTAKKAVSRSAAVKKQPSDSKTAAARTAAAKQKWAAIKKAADRKAAADRISARKAAAKKAAAVKKEAERKAAAKKAAAKKSAAKKSASKKRAATKTVARKTAPKKTVAKKPAPKKPVAKKSTARKTSAKKSTARKSTARKSTARKSTARKSTARKSTARKSTARKSTARKSTARKSTARRSTAPARTAARSRPPAALPTRSARPIAEPPRISSRPGTASPPARATNRPPARPVQSATPRSARRTAGRTERPEPRRPRPSESDGFSSPPEREMAARRDDSRPAAPTRTPIRIDSGVPRRGESNGPPIIRADRADQSREEPAGVGALSSDSGTQRQGRFRFRRSRNRS